MSDITDLIGLTRGYLSEDISRSDWQKAGHSLDGLADLTVEALLQGSDDDINVISKTVTSAFGQLSAIEPVDTTLGPVTIACHLGGLSRVLNAALRKRRSLTHDEAVAVVEELTVKILTDLAQANQPRSTGEIAQRLDKRAEVIARKLPLLRDAGLIRSKPAGRYILNEITPLGRQSIHLLAIPTEIPAPPPPPFVTELLTLSAESPKSSLGPSAHVWAENRNQLPDLPQYYGASSPRGVVAFREDDIVVLRRRSPTNNILSKIRPSLAKPQASYSKTEHVLRSSLSSLAKVS